MATTRELAAAALKASVELHQVLEVYPLDDDQDGAVYRACQGAAAAMWCLDEVFATLDSNLPPDPR